MRIIYEKPEHNSKHFTAVKACGRVDGHFDYIAMRSGVRASNGYRDQRGTEIVYAFLVGVRNEGRKITAVSAQCYQT